MADDKRPFRNRGLNKTPDIIKNGMDALYRNTYFASTRNANSLEQIKSSIDDSIDKLIDNNYSNTGSSSIASMYNRLQEKNLRSYQQSVKELDDLFNDSALTDMIMNTWASNRYIKEYDNDIDILCKYMPQLEEALNVKKDNVLAADHFSKDYLNVTSTKKVNTEEFNRDIKKLKKQYKLLEKFEEYYWNASKYGEEFVYIVPYKKAFQKLIGSNGTFGNINESSNLADSSHYSVIYESANDTSLLNDIDIKHDKNISLPNVSIEINKSNVLPFAVEEYRKQERYLNSSLLESTCSFDNIIPDDMDLKGLKDNEYSQDGLVIDKNINKEINKIPGAIVKTLKRECVKPIYIDDMCLGYYYLEWLGTDDPFSSNNQINNFDPMFMSNQYGGQVNGKEEGMINKNQEDMVLRQLAQKISSLIDVNFLKNNQDLRKEIYMMLKYNDDIKKGNKAQFRVTFIPPEDIVHIYFKKNPITHRGISDLEGSILPATLYTGLYMSNTLGILTRGYDRRVYYVKQSIDSNISKTLLNAINQIKKSNFGSREMTSIKHILNITGRYNDFLIPTNSSGEAPINFEIMPGQNIDLKTPLMEEFERMAVNRTEVPLEMVQIRENSVDYAVQMTMVNSKFIRVVFKRQSKLNNMFSEIMTKIYNYEFDKEDDLEVKLPPPTYLNLMQTTNMLDNNENYVSKVTEMVMPDESDELKILFKKNLSKSMMATFIDYELVTRIKEESEMELSKITNQSSDTESEE